MALWWLYGGYVFAIVIQPENLTLKSKLRYKVNTPVKLAFGVDKINNKLNFCMEFGNIARDHLSKVPKNPRPASWDIANIRNDRQP